jgi:hypothetical protein
MLVYTEANNSTRDTVVTKKREKEVRDDDENKDGMVRSSGFRIACPAE